MRQAYQHISADSHFELSPDKWTHRVPQQHRDRAPRRIKLADGRDAIVVEGRGVVYGGTDLFAGQTHQEWSPAKMDLDGSVGAGPPGQRLRELDQDGIDAEILYPGGASGARNTKGIRDQKAYLAVNRAYNEFLAEEYCSASPDRLIGVGLLPVTGVEDAIQEMEHCAQLGLKAVMLETFPDGKGYPTPEDDRFWAAAIDSEMPLTIHTSFPHRYGGREVPLLKYPQEPEGELRPPVDFVERLARHGVYHGGSVEAAQLVVTGVFHRFPKLKIYWAEDNIGWVPYWLQQLDREYQANCHWAERLLGLKRLDRLPSEYLREQAYWGFFEDPIGIRLRHEVGVDHILWSTDFPHEVTRWPHSLEFLESQMAGVPEEERYKMVAGNAVQFFHLGQR